MKTIKVKEILPDFATYSETITVKRIKEKMFAVSDEDIHYVADELIVLGEEILNNVAALGVALYIEKAGEMQLDQYNDYILNNLFLNKGHQNAGPIFKKVCFMLQKLQNDTSSELNIFIDLFKFENQWNKQLNDLAKFRNSLMHGFFVLPAKTNEEQTKKIKGLLDHLSELGVFIYETNFHFRDENGFTGDWHINESDKLAWDKLENTTLFGQLIKQVKIELFDPTFWEYEKSEKKQTLPHHFAEDISKKNFGAIAYWFHPAEKEKQNSLFQSIISHFHKEVETEIVAYTIHENGIAHTEDFLFNNKIIKERIELIKKNTVSNPKNETITLDKKIIVIVNDFHLGFYSPNHLVNAIQKLKEYQVNVIALGYEYEFLNSFFNLKISQNSSKSIPSEEKRKQLIYNYLRYRGPFKGEKDFELIVDVMNDLCEKLANGEVVYARKFAEEKNVDSIFTDEVFSMLFPMLKYNNQELIESINNKYEEDKVHELYGFPLEIKETSSIYLALRRRDITLELKHKLLSI
jgi:hypothetical protein